MSVTLDQLASHFDQSMRAYFSEGFPDCIGVAVSGGSDSLATLFLTAQWCRDLGIDCRAVVIDHALRDQSSAEAKWVVQTAKDLGVPCSVMVWSHDGVSSNIQAQARTARYQLIDAWRGEIKHVVTGHTYDDQVETVLLRLKRGSGVDGLSGMSNHRDMQGENRDWNLLRPNLTVERSVLRDYLNQQGQTWIDDPSNDNEAFDRVQMRRLIPQLHDYGITSQIIVKTADRMRRAQHALDHYTRELAKTSVSIEYGDVIVDPHIFQTAPDDIQFRLLAQAISWVGSNTYKPRFSALETARQVVEHGKAVNVAGTVVFQHKGNLRVTREYEAIKSLEAHSHFDKRWSIACGPTEVIRALGPEMAVTLDKSTRKLIPHRTLIVQPAIFEGNELKSVPSLEPTSQKGATICGQDIFVSHLRH